MSGLDWVRVKQVFQAAIEADPGARQDLARELCGGDGQLLAEVESLLDSHAAAGSFAERPAEEMLAALTDAERDVPAMPLRRLSTAERIGPYEILAPIASGGMGDVYEARDTRLDRIVAIKVLRSGTTTMARDRFEREARAVGQLSHPHICALYDVGHHAGLDFLVMEHLEGETLASRLSRGPLSWEHALEVGIELASALDCAHRAGFVHRDLKPGNVFLVRRPGASGRPLVKLLDFGLAKPTSDLGARAARSVAASNEPLTRPGAFVGTVGYMAPEQLEGRPVDARTDVFALGAVIYEAIAGRRAFDDSSDARVIAAVLEHEPPPLSAVHPGIPPAVERIVITCLAKDPDERWQTARDLQRALAWVRDGDLAVRAPDAAPTGVRRRRAVGWATAALLTFAAGVWAYWPRQAPPAAASVTFSIHPPAGTRFPRGAAEMAIAADGRRLVFVALSADGIRRLWLREFDAIESRAIQGTDDASYPFWSPDSESIGFFAEGTLRRVAAAGGRAQVLCSVGLAGQGATWSSNGTILFSSYGEGLRRVADTGGQPVAVTVRDPALAESGHAWPVFMPDGQHFLYLSRSTDPTHTAIFQGALDSTETRRLFTAESRAGFAGGHILSMEHGALMAQPYDFVRGRLTGDPITVAPAIAQDSPLRSGGAFAAGGDPAIVAYRSATPEGHLQWFERSGRVTDVKVPPGDYQNPSLSPDEQQIAVEKTDPTTGRHTIWIVDGRRGLTSRLVADSAGAHMPVWSPDGNRIVFSSNRLGGIDLYEIRADGSGFADLLLGAKDRTGFTPMDWSNDGRQLLYAAGPDGRRHLWILPMRPRQDPRLWLAEANAAETQGQFSTDGRWIAYSSNESGAYEVYVQPSSGMGRRWQVSTSGGAQPRWRRDGRELFYLAPDGNLMAVDVAAKGSDLDTGVPHALFNTGITGSLIDRRNQYLVARDGRRFLVNVSAEDRGSAPITVIVNWTPPGTMR